MKQCIAFFTLFAFVQSYNASAQKWVDTLYQITQVNDIHYDTQIDFAGNSRDLKLNIAMPVNDTVPPCGRPVMLVVHGGAFLTGSKDQDAPPALIRDFAKRGYLAASIDYRLGMFQTQSFINCNVSMFGVPWNCLNMQDTAEWYRAAYRGMQDVKSALRYLINHAATYQIDVRNIFLVGESAGGFIALSAAFMDDNSEKPVHCTMLPDVLPPNALYENQCIQTPGYDTSIALMNLQRPDLGDVAGYGNPTTIPFTIKGVGNFYGAIMQDLFSTYSYSQAPRLYLYHQPNDLVVPYDHDQVLQGEAYCFTQFPANCQWLINRPEVWGSKGIRDLINGLNGIVNVLPMVYFDSTLNTADCAAQIANPALTGHSIDQYWLRTKHMAQFFAPAIDTGTNCTPLISLEQSAKKEIRIYPNPLSGNELFIQSETAIKMLLISNLQGQLIFTGKPLSEKLTLPHLSHGLYLLTVQTDAGMSYIRLLR